MVLDVCADFFYEAWFIHDLLVQNTFLFEYLFLGFVERLLSKSKNLHHYSMFFEYNKLHEFVDSCSLSDGFAEEITVEISADVAHNGVGIGDSISFMQQSG